jgi:tetratricopeptide (TPR) repeat protein
MILKFLTMKKTSILISAFLFSGIISGQSPFDYLLKGKALTEMGKPDQAIEILSSALKEKYDSRLFSEKAEASMVKGDLSGAISDFNSANNITQYSGEYGLARVYAMRGDAATSLYHLELNLKSHFRKSEKEIMMDPAFSKIENRPEWRSFWKKEWYSIPEKSLSEIQYYLSKRKTKEAASILSELQRDYSGTEAAIFAGASVNLSEGKYGEAIKSLTGLLVSDPENEIYLRTLAKALTGVSNFAGATVTYSKLISLEIPDAGLLKLRAECYRKTGEADKAMIDIEKYLKFYPENEDALSLAGRVEAASGNNLKALEYFSRNLILHPGDPACYVDRANSYLLSKSWEWAEKDYSMSLDLDPGNSEAWLNKGIALVNSGKAVDACHDFRMALSLGNKRATDYISRYCIK